MKNYLLHTAIAAPNEKFGRGVLHKCWSGNWINII